MKNKTPMIGITSNTLFDDDNSFVIKEKYMDSILKYMKCIPVGILNCSSREFCHEGLLDNLDGIVLSGGDSHIYHNIYCDGNCETFNNHYKKDKWRDNTTLPLLKMALKKKIPIFGICRGMQELNIALGGTLKYVTKSEFKTSIEHDASLRNGKDEYKPKHYINIKEESFLHKISGMVRAKVNSIHEQAIDKVADALEVIATSEEDNVIEAIKCNAKECDGFCMGVQWHPEHKTSNNNELNSSIWKEFSRACYAYKEKKLEK